MLALSYGSSNGQRTVGIIALLLYRGGITGSFLIPSWVIVASALSQSLGISLGGWRVIRKVGTGIYRLRPLNGFVSQVVSAAVVILATLLGGPVSLNQIASSAIIGTGLAEHKSRVHWREVNHLAVAWVLTLPLTGFVAIVIYPVASLIAR